MNELYVFFSGSFFSMYFFSCAGALLLWMRVKGDLRRSNSLSEFFDTLFEGAERKSAFAKLTFFILFGGFVGVLLVAPTTPVQAATAGLAWTRIAAKD